MLPVFYSDNYISLLPGEKQTIVLSFDKKNVEQAYLQVEAWNNKTIKQKLY